MILDSERAYLLEMRSLATDAEGREVLVGLNFEETAFYMAHVRDRVALNYKRSADHEEQAERYLRLVCTENPIRVYRMIESAKLAR
jgi:hypothetical protein